MLPASSNTSFALGLQQIKEKEIKQIKEEKEKEKTNGTLNVLEDSVDSSRGSNDSTRLQLTVIAGFVIWEGKSRSQRTNSQTVNTNSQSDLTNFLWYLS